MQTNNTIQKITRTKQPRFENETVTARKCKKNLRLERRQARQAKHLQIEVV